MTTFKKQYWDELIDRELDIFKAQEQAEAKEYEDWLATQNN
jgi:hypothetical protein